MNNDGIANIKVIDIYHGDGSIDFMSLKTQGYDGVIIKATQGTTFKDNMCAANYAGAKAAGLHTGFYHFFDIANLNGADQANFFLSAISSFESDYLPVIDIEQPDSYSSLPNPSALSQSVKAALDAIKAKYGAAMIYSNPVTLRQLSASALGSYPLWIAEYNASQVQDVPGYGPWTGWQYTSTPRDEDIFTSGVFLKNVPIAKPSGQNSIWGWLTVFFTWLKSLWSKKKT